MRRHLLTGIASAGLLFTVVAAPAQYLPRADRYYDRDASLDSARLMERLHADLDRAESTASRFKSDLERIANAREAINVFQGRLNEGNYDRRELTEAIVSVQRVLDNNRLYERVRDALIDDLNRMREMRVANENWR